MGNVRAVGTKTSVASTSLLPVPRIPMTCQVSITWQLSRGRYAITTSGSPSARDGSPAITVAVVAVQWASWQLLTKGAHPVMRPPLDRGGLHRAAKLRSDHDVGTA